MNSWKIKANINAVSNISNIVKNSDSEDSSDYRNLSRQNSSVNSLPAGDVHEDDDLTIRAEPKLEALRLGNMLDSLRRQKAHTALRYAEDLDR